jgi:GNAT superfamily N-acetyltransferase
MGIACQIVKNTSGNIVNVEAPNGNDSLLYRSLLNTLNDETTAINLWSYSYTDEFNEAEAYQPKDRNGEHLPRTVFNNISSTNLLESSKELKKSDVVLIQETKAKTLLEALKENIPSEVKERIKVHLAQDKANIKEIEELLNSQTENPQEIIKDLVGIKNRQNFDKKVQDVAPPQYIEKYNSNLEFADQEYNKYSSMQLIEVYNEKDGQLVEVLENDTEQDLFNSLKPGISNVSVASNIEFLSEIGEEVWYESEKEIKNILKDIQTKTINIGVDTTSIVEDFNSKTRTEILNYLNSVSSLTSLLYLDMQTDEDISNFAQIHNEYNKITSTPKTQAIPETEYSVAQIYTNLSEIEMFENFGYIKVGQNLYQKVDKEEDFLENIYELVVQSMENPVLKDVVVTKSESNNPSFEDMIDLNTDGGKLVIGKVKGAKVYGVTELKVEEDKRRQGIATKLLQRALDETKGELSGMASNDMSVGLNYNLGMRAFDTQGKELSLEETKTTRAKNAGNSIRMILPENKTGVNYKSTQTPQILPNQAFYPTAFNNKGEFKVEKVTKPENKEAIKQDIKTYLESKTSEDTNLPIVAFKTAFGHPITKTTEPTPSPIYQEILNSVKEDVAYLTGEFLSDLKIETLKEKLKDSVFYNKVLKHLDVNERGIELKPTANLKEVQFYTPKNHKFIQYTYISKNPQINSIFAPNIVTDLIEKTPKFLKNLYVNNPKMLPNYKGEYILTDDGKVKILNKADNFIRIGSTLLERVAPNYYQEIEGQSDSLFFIKDDSLNDTFAYTSKESTITKEADEIKLNNVASKKEIEEAQDEIDCN